MDSIRASVKTLKYHLKNIKPDSYINKQGFLVRNNTNIHNNLNEINKLANLYYEFSYKKGNLNISSPRLEYLKQIIEITEDNNIDLKIMLTPVHNILYNKIVSNKNLFEKLIDFKIQLKNIHEYKDYMIDSIENRNNLYFEDAVHYTEEYGNLLITDIIKGE
jgi:hypothetical protein